MSTQELLKRYYEHVEYKPGIVPRALADDLAAALRESERQLAEAQVDVTGEVAILELQGRLADLRTEKADADLAKIELEIQLDEARSAHAATSCSECHAARLAMRESERQTVYERGRAETAEQNLSFNAGVLAATDPDAAVARVATLEQQLAEAKRELDAEREAHAVTTASRDHMVSTMQAMANAHAADLERARAELSATQDAVRANDALRRADVARLTRELSVANATLALERHCMSHVIQSEGVMYAQCEQCKALRAELARRGGK